MKIIRYALILIVCASLAWVGCKKIPVGFIGETMYYKDSPFSIEQGNVKVVTSSLNLDGSTLPVLVKLLEVRKKEQAKKLRNFMQNMRFMFTNSQLIRT
ncbi:hypothetical protein [Pedobacter panaciterrae]